MNNTANNTVSQARLNIFALAIVFGLVILAVSAGYLIATGAMSFHTDCSVIQGVKNLGCRK